MEDAQIPRRLVRQLENPDTFPLVALQAIRDIRAHLDTVERRAILRAQELGASVQDIADHLGITRQGAYYKLKLLDEADPTD